MGLLVYLGLVVLCIGDIKGAPSVPGNENEEAKVFSQDSPHFLSQHLDLVVDEGTAVRLPCMLDTLAGFQLIWRKNGRIITVGDQIVDKSESKFSLEDRKNGNTLVIEDVDETDEAHFSCSISTASGAEIDHNLRVITRMSGNEMDHIAAENPQAVVLEEIENSEQGSGFVTDPKENIIQIDQEPVFTDDTEQEEEIILDNKDASSMGKVYFARVPSFYTFPDDGNRDVTEREQLIKHAPKSVREFLKLLRIYQSSVLTKDDIQEFNEFVFEKKPIPNTHLLRSTHAYNSNLRKSLQSANIKEMESSKVISEEDSQSINDLKTESLQRVKSPASSSREDVFESAERVKENVDTASTQYMDTSRESQSSPEESQEEGSFGDNEEDDDLGSGKSEEELNASFTEIDWKLDEDKTAQYSSGVRYLQGQNIGDVEEEGIDYISEDRKFPILRGQYLPKVDIEDYDLNPEKFKEKTTNIDSDDDASFVTQLESEDVIGREADETRSNTNEEAKNYEEIAENEDDASFVRKIESEDVVGKKADETKSKTNEDEFIQINESGHDEKETDNEKLDDVHVDRKVKINWYESRPEHYVFADRYLQENEIGELESEQDTGEEDSYIPLFRGQHLLKTDLEESEAEHGEDADDYESYNGSEVLADTKESVKNVESKHISNEERVAIESNNEAEETPESYFPLSCCLPKTSLQESESAAHSKQVSNDKRLEIKLQIDVKDKHGEESLEALSLEKKQESNEALNINKHGNNVQEKSDDNNQESIAHIYGEANYKKKQDLSSSPRYLNEEEIDHIEDESVDLTQNIMIPVIRGRHLPEYTLEQLNAKHFEYILEEDEESLKYKKSGKNVQIHSSDESENPSKHVKPESYDITETSNINQQEQSVKDSKNTLHIDMEKETLYPQEIKDIERSYFTQNPQEEKVLSSGKDIKHKDGSNQVDEEHHQEMDPNKQATNHEITFDRDRKIEEEDVLVSSEDLHRNDVDEDAIEIRIAQEREIIPLQVLLNEESKERVYEHTPAMRKKVISKEKRRDGPHPFRFICMIRKCWA